jgi:hypothetical protein
MGNRVSMTAALHAIEIYKSLPAQTLLKVTPTGDGYSYLLAPVQAGDQLLASDSSPLKSLSDLEVDF